MPVRVDIDIYADDALGVLARLDTCFNAEGMTSFMGGDVLPWLRQRAAGRFATEGDDASGKWAPLKPSTVDIREGGIERGIWPGISPEHPINQRTGIMHDYIARGRAEIVSGGPSTTMYFPRRTPPTPQLANKIKRAQVGDSRTARRPVLAINQTDVTEIVSRLAYFIRRGVQK